MILSGVVMSYKTLFRGKYSDKLNAVFSTPSAFIGCQLKTVKDLLSDRVQTIYRIRALRDFGNVKADDLGGFIEHEGNLNHEGNCWVGGNAWIYDDSYISDDAQVCGQC